MVMIITAMLSSNGNNSYTNSSTNTAVRSEYTLRKGAPTPEQSAGPTCIEELAKDSNASVKAYKAGDYQAAYTAATKGLQFIETSCEDEAGNPHVQYVAKGMLLSFKGLAEHHLPQGDARTDLNQANSLLVECQTEPGIYGTHEAAVCESQEQNNISATTNWEMNSQ